jgi:pimeloyl-ACP methyl ester carboxylesterase
MVLKRALGADAQDDEGLRAAVRRTDGQARQLMIEAVVAGKGSDQRALVETSLVPIAIVNGQDDPGIDLDYIDGISFANVWTCRPTRISEAGHGLHHEQSETFNRVVLAFVNDIEAAR